MENVKILVVDDHAIFRVGLINYLQNQFPGCEIKECECGLEALNYLRNEEPQIALIDINLPKLSGIEILKVCRNSGITSKVIILSVFDEKEVIERCMECGANAFVSKDAEISSVYKCVNELLRPASDGLPSKTMIFKSSEITFADDKIYRKTSDLRFKLTAIEIKIIKLIAKQNTSSEIGKLLFLSEKTIEIYRYNVCKKLSLPARTSSLIHWVFDNKEVVGLL